MGLWGYLRSNNWRVGYFKILGPARRSWDEAQNDYKNDYTVITDYIAPDSDTLT